MKKTTGKKKKITGKKGTAFDLEAYDKVQEISIVGGKPIYCASIDGKWFVIRGESVSGPYPDESSAIAAAGNHL